VAAPQKRGRGRPKSEATIQREKIDALFASRPSYLPKEESALTKALREAKPHNDAVEQQILRDYKYDATVPDDHAFTMASLGDESLYGHEAAIIAQDQAHIARVARQRANGARATKQNASYRAAKVTAKNKVMLSEFLYARGESVYAVAKKILVEWDYVSAEQRIRDETITARGDGGPVPSHRTLRDWIASQLNTPTNNIGKGSLD
jgi:hypothetical protein